MLLSVLQCTGQPLLGTVVGTESVNSAETETLKTSRVSIKKHTRKYFLKFLLIQDYMGAIYLLPLLVLRSQKSREPYDFTVCGI